MSVKSTDNTVTFLAEATRKTNLALRFMLDAIDSTANPNTPKDKGDLRNNKIKIVSNLHDTIQWRSKYAGAQEAGQFTVKAARVVKIDAAVGAASDKDKGFRTLKPGVYKFKHYTTDGTGAHFAKNAVKKVRDDAERYFRQAGL